MEKKDVPASENFHGFARTLYFKVKIQCCDRCPRKAEKNLKKIPGVVAVTIDTDQGVVAVTGTVDPQLIIQKFGKWGKTAMLCPPPKEPVQSVHGHSTPFGQNNDATNKHSKKDSDCCCSGDDSDSNENVTMMKQQFSDTTNNPVVYPAASIGSVIPAKKSSCWSRLFGKKKAAVEPNLQRPKFRGVTPAFNPNSNMNTTGNNYNMLASRMPVSYGAPRPQYPPHPQRMPGHMPYGAARMPMHMPYGAARMPMHMPYGAPMPQYVSQFYGQTPYGRAAMPSPYPHHPAVYPPPFQPSGYFHSRPPGHYNPMIHYTRYEDNYYGY